MQFQTLICGPIAVNTYIIGAAGEKECIVIDPGVAEPVLEHLRETGLCCTHILITHGHFDHIGGVKRLKEVTGAKVCIHALDEPALHSSKTSLALLLSSVLEPADADVLLQDGDTITAAGLSLTVMHTPGHSPGCVCYILKSEKTIFSGDTLFYDSYGRTDLPGSSFAALKDSIQNKLFALEGDYTVYPGHGESTTLAYERLHNQLSDKRQ